MNNRLLQAFITPLGSIQLEWEDTPELVSKSTLLLQDEIHRRYIANSDAWLLFLGFCDNKVMLSPSLTFLRTFTILFTRKLRLTPELEMLRDKVDFPLAESELKDIKDSVPLMSGAEYLNSQWFENIWSMLHRSFGDAIKTYSGSVAQFIKTLSLDVHLIGRIFFHLVENRQGSQPFAFLATYSTRLNRQGQSKHLPLKHALQEYDQDRDKLLELLSTVHLAAQKSPLISALAESGELFHPLAWSAKDAFTFLKEVPLYEESGILCRIPDWWKAKSAGIRLNIAIGEKKPSIVGMDAILNFNAYLLIGDMGITQEQARQLLEESEGLALIKNKWVAVDHEKLRKTLDAYEKAQQLMRHEGLSIRDALQLTLNPEKMLAMTDHDSQVSITHGEWLGSVFEKLLNPDLIKAIKVSRTFKAHLRKYQQKGLNWLYFLHSLKFGACLADDMGLGKTIQLLAFLSVIRSDKKQPASLLVIPASLISNWVNEIKRFYPTLKYIVAHPDMHSKKKVPPQSKDQLDAMDLVMTTYALAQKFEWVRSYTWNYIILDEAQAIKNPGTQQTRSIKKLQSHNRIIMTGTPVENRLSDLWSLFDFLNPGLLGNRTEFSAFAKQLSTDPQGYPRLRKVISPYILRRLKTDKSIISDLPDKVEVKTYASLSKKQVILYQQLVHEIDRMIQDSEGIQRKGLILSSLMKFKQLCNHPGQYLGNGDFEEKNSGKYARLREICETIFEKREKLLIFTQFKEMTAPLEQFLSSIFNRNGLILHGSIPVKKRKEIIERFQSPEYVPFMVLSLKAGGVGLNLTQANHVIHFDRWWNPAVENQATDRAFRIGQQKNVMVHKFITQGTIEEKIDRMIEEKQKLSKDVIESQTETWLTEMDNEQILNLIKLTL